MFVWLQYKTDERIVSVCRALRDRGKASMCYHGEFLGTEKRRVEGGGKRGGAGRGGCNWEREPRTDTRGHRCGNGMEQSMRADNLKVVPCLDECSSSSGLSVREGYSYEHMCFSPATERGLEISPRDGCRSPHRREFSSCAVPPRGRFYSPHPRAFRQVERTWRNLERVMTPRPWARVSGLSSLTLQIDDFATIVHRVLRGESIGNCADAVYACVTRNRAKIPMTSCATCRSYHCAGTSFTIAALRSPCLLVGAPRDLYALCGKPINGDVKA